MQDLPDHAAEPMSDGPEGGLIAQPRQQTPEHGLKIAAFLRDGSVRRLIQHSAQIFIAFCGTTAVVLLGAFLPLSCTTALPPGVEATERAIKVTHPHVLPPFPPGGAARPRLVQTRDPGQTH